MFEEKSPLRLSSIFPNKTISISLISYFDLVTSLESEKEYLLRLLKLFISES